MFYICLLSCTIEKILTISYIFYFRKFMRVHCCPYTDFVVSQVEPAHTVLYLEDRGEEVGGTSTFSTWRMEEMKGVEPVQYILYAWRMEVRRGGTSTYPTWRMRERKGVEPAHWVLSATSKASRM
jgi:hypothetical protein